MKLTIGEIKHIINEAGTTSNIPHEEVKRLKAIAYGRLGDDVNHGTFQTHGMFLLFVYDSNRPTKIWTNVPEKLVFGQLRKPKPLDWWEYGNLHHAQQKELVWMSPAQRGKEIQTGAQRYRTASGPDNPGASVHAVANDVQMTGRPSARGDVALSDKARSMKEPTWGDLPHAELRKIIPPLIAKAKSDPRYKKTLKKVLMVALDKNMMSDVAKILSAVPSLKSESVAKITYGELKTLIREMNEDYLTPKKPDGNAIRKMRSIETELERVKKLVGLVPMARRVEVQRHLEMAQEIIKNNRLGDNK